MAGETKVKLFGELKLRITLGNFAGANKWMHRFKIPQLNSPISIIKILIY